MQGSGKVGGSFIEEMARYPVIFTAVADRDGALTGRLDPAELLRAPQADRPGFIAGLKPETRRRLARCLRHPEAALIDPGAAALAEWAEQGLTNPHVQGGHNE